MAKERGWMQGLYSTVHAQHDFALAGKGEVLVPVMHPGRVI
jgi:hypothetical protein